MYSVGIMLILNLELDTPALFSNYLDAGVNGQFEEMIARS
jgi:hypothetical protein